MFLNSDTAATQFDHLCRYTFVLLLPLSRSADIFWLEKDSLIHKLIQSFEKALFEVLFVIAICILYVLRLRNLKVDRWPEVMQHANENTLHQPLLTCDTSCVNISD